MAFADIMKKERAKLQMTQADFASMLYRVLVLLHQVGGARAAQGGDLDSFHYYIKRTSRSRPRSRSATGWPGGWCRGGKDGC